MGVLGGRWEFLTGDLKDRVILDVMDDLVWPQGRYPESFMLISLSKVCQEWGVKIGGTWRTLRVPYRRLGGQGLLWCHEWSCLTLRKEPWKFRVDIFIRSVSRIGVLGGRWGFLTRDSVERVIFDHMDVLGRPQWSHPESFVSLSLFLAKI